MTLAEKLREKAHALDVEGKQTQFEGPRDRGDRLVRMSQDLRALADYVDGRVLVGATVQRFALEQRWFATIGDSLPEYVSPSASVEEAFTDLQREIDNIDGRVMP